MSANQSLDPQLNQLASALFQQWSAQMTTFRQELSERLDQHQDQILALSVSQSENLEKTQKNVSQTFSFSQSVFDSQSEKIKFEPVPEFHGKSEKAEEFLIRLRIFFEVHSNTFTNDKDKVIYFISRLKH
jgi:hypothetical protein